jgi:uncharacterized membrane protein YtjA (UPF0391 family)
VPLMAFLWCVQRFALRERLREGAVVAYGVVIAVVGMILFNLGLSYGLSELGAQTGALVPAAFSPHPGLPDSPLFGYAAGIGIALAFAACLGLGATLAAPALLTMGIQVEHLTDGAFPRRTLVWAVAAGVALGTTAGMAKILFQVPLVALLVPGYVVALAMTVLAPEEYVNLAWDSAGVTTGPVTVPLVLALGLGLGRAVNAAEGFGVLAMASIGPILTVLAVGLWLTLRQRLARHAVAEAK